MPTSRPEWCERVGVQESTRLRLQVVLFKRGKLVLAARVGRKVTRETAWVRELHVANFGRVPQGQHFV